MGRRLRTPIPQHHSLLILSLPDYTNLAEKVIREKQAASYNTRHRARQLSHLSSGQRVWITDSKTEGTVVASHSALCSYLVESPQGTIRRNRRHLVPMLNTEHVLKISPKRVIKQKRGSTSWNLQQPKQAKLPWYTKHDQEGQ